MMSAYAMLQMEVNIADFAEILGENGTSFRKAAELRREAMNKLMWDEHAGMKPCRSCAMRNSR